MEGNEALVIFGVVLLLIAPELIKFIQACVQADSE
jgi:hypothetical protein